MAQQANITVFDGAATPVSHTLIAVSTSREKDVVKSVWRESLPGVPIEAQVRLTTMQTQLPSGVYKVDVVAEVPVLETIGAQNSAGYTAAPKVAFVDTIKVQGLFHARSDIVSRRRVRQLAINVLGAVSTSVTPATSGMAPDLFDQLIPAS